MTSKPITPADLKVLSIQSRMLDKQEFIYFKKIYKVKNNYLNNVLNNLSLFQKKETKKEIEEEFILESALAEKEVSKKTIQLFSLYTYKQLDQEPLESFIDLMQTDYYNRYGSVNSTLASKTTIKDINKILIVNQNEPIAKIKKELKRIKGINGYRADTIARTETGFASHYAQKETTQQAVRDIPQKLYKKWLSVNDNRTRRSPPARYDHSAMNGVIVAEDKLFNVQGDRIYSPRDPSGQAGNVINCRCVYSILKQSEI